MNRSCAKAAVKYVESFAGLTVDRIVDGKHIKLYLSTPVGPKVFTAPRSARDGRAALNNNSLLNNWSKGIDK